MCAALWLRRRARLQQALTGRESVEQGRAGLAAALDTVPLAALWWRRDGAEESPIGRVPGGEAGSPYAGFLAGFDSADAARLEAAGGALRRPRAGIAGAVGAIGGGGLQPHRRRHASRDSAVSLPPAAGPHRAAHKPP